MNTLRIRGLAADLAQIAHQLHIAGDGDNARLLDESIERLRTIADELDVTLSRLGNPPTDQP
jgi:hypothetical protein